MFERSMLPGAAVTRRTYGTLAGVLTQTVLLTAAVMVPLVFPEALPSVQRLGGIFAPPSPPPPPRPPVVTQIVSTTRIPTQVPGGFLTEPVAMPPAPVMIDEPPQALEQPGGPGVPGVVGGIGDGVLTPLTASVAQVAVPKPAVAEEAHQAAAKPADAPARQIKVSTGVQEAMIVHRVIPIYPLLARQARISGVVQLTGIIGTDGRIKELRLISGHPLLAPAALDAVRQWVYRPTLLSGQAVEVIAPITVTFALH